MSRGEDKTLTAWKKNAKDIARIDQRPLMEHKLCALVIKEPKRYYIADERGTRAVILDPRNKKNRTNSWNHHNASSLMWLGPLSRVRSNDIFFTNASQ